MQLVIRRPKVRTMLSVAKIDYTSSGNSNSCMFTCLVKGDAPHMASLSQFTLPIPIITYTFPQNVQGLLNS